ncbi:MAG: PRC-barrel domain-containing protein, partial [bacterium]
AIIMFMSEGRYRDHIKQSGGCLMLRSVKELQGYVLAAKDGEIGRCKDFLFDDSAWTIRYMVADSGKWLPKRKVLISPMSLREPDWESRLFPVILDKEQIEKSPTLESDAPVSRQYEREWYKYFNWSPYWYGGGIWGAGAQPWELTERATTKDSMDEAVEAPTHNLRSIHEVTGYHIHATDGEIGHVDDFVVDDSLWTIRYLVVDTRNWLPGRKVLVSPKWAKQVDWKSRTVHVDLERKLVKNAPAFDAKAPVNREYEARLYDYYGRPAYWD